MKEIYERKEVIGGIPVYRIGHTGKKEFILYFSIMDGAAVPCSRGHGG